MNLAKELELRVSLLAARREIATTNPAMKDAADRDEAELLAITAALDEHPEGYEGPCMCDVCQSYATPDEAVPDGVVP